MVDLRPKEAPWSSRDPSRFLNHYLLPSKPLTPPALETTPPFTARPANSPSGPKSTPVTPYATHTYPPAATIIALKTPPEKPTIENTVHPRQQTHNPTTIQERINITVITKDTVVWSGALTSIALKGPNGVSDTSEESC